MQFHQQSLYNLYTYTSTGTLWKNPKVIRRGKWKVTKAEWGQSKFAKKACPGSGYLITGDAVPKLRDAISKVL